MSANRYVNVSHSICDFRGRHKLSVFDGAPDKPERAEADEQEEFRKREARAAAGGKGGKAGHFSSLFHSHITIPLQPRLTRNSSPRCAFPAVHACPPAHSVTGPIESCWR